MILSVTIVAVKYLEIRLGRRPSADKNAHLQNYKSLLLWFHSEILNNCLILLITGGEGPSTQSPESREGRDHSRGGQTVGP